MYNTIVNIEEAPTFKLTLNNKYVSGTFTVVDLSWYSQYKALGDNVICMFFYIGFIWYVFKHSSSIISGASSSVEKLNTVVTHDSSNS